MPLDGSGIVYAAHAYCFGCRTGITGLPTYLDQSVAPTAAEYPVAILEFGTNRSDAGLHNRRVITWASSRSLWWAAYSWTNVSAADPWGLLQRSGGYEPNLNGKPVHDALGDAQGW
jgi:hypothetical protein